MRRTGKASCILGSRLAKGVGCTLGSGSGCGGWAGWLARDTSACAVCPACEGGGWGDRATGTAGCEEVCRIATATEADEIVDGSDTDVDGIRTSGLCTGAGGTEEAGGELGMTVAGTRPSCDSNGWGAEVTGTTGSNGDGACDITIATGVGEIGDGSGTAIDGLSG